MAITPRSLVLATISTIQRLIDFILNVAILSYLFLFTAQFLHSIKLHHSLRIVHDIADPILVLTGSWLGLHWPSSGPSVLPLVVAAAIWLLKVFVDMFFVRTHRGVGELLPAPRLAAAGGVPLGFADLGFTNRSGGDADSEKAREQLLKRYREIEKILQMSKRKVCTFLSVDVVASTQMKVGEPDTAIAATFQAYEEMLKNIFQQYGAWKQAWTPDGVMACFLQADLGVEAAKNILRSLSKFNQTENNLRMPFHLRCGANMGNVMIYEDSKLEKVVGHVSDVAGHMQKRCSVDCLWISSDLYNVLADKSGFRSMEREVDGQKIYEWSLSGNEPPAKSFGE